MLYTMQRENKNRNTRHIEIDNKKISQRTLEVIKGEKGIDEIKEDWIPIAKALEYPEEFPFLLSDILKVKKDVELRRALIRVQIDAQLRLNEDLDFYKKQLFAAESIEILLFRRLRLKPKGKRKKKKKKREGESEETDDEETDDEETDDEETDDEEN